MTIKSISIPIGVWPKIYNQLARDYPASYILSRSKSKEKLGFTPRRHSTWEPGMVDKKDTIILDFYDEQKKLLFLLKFGHYIK